MARNLEDPSSAHPLRVLIAGGGLDQLDRFGFIVGNLYVWLFFNGTVTNGELTGSGLRLDDGGQVDLGNDPSLNPMQEMTVCLWVTVLHDHPGSWHLLATNPRTLPPLKLNP